MSDSLKLSPEEDHLSTIRHEFVIPTFKSMKAAAVPDRLQDDPCTYMCGNSLGLLTKRSRRLVHEELDVWGTRAVEGHFDHPYDRSWMYIADTVHPILAELVGAKESEVACMSTLTANLHLMINTFYRPTKERFKLLCEARAFPSDQASTSRGFDPATAIIELSPRPGEFTLREEDILSAIAEQGSSIALVLFSGVQYYTGQLFPMQKITKAAQDQGCVCGWDLAHAIGNVPLSLHDWNVDFAVWCSYKYVNSGPGGIGGLFVHDKWEGEEIRQAGWWGHDPTTRFAMPPKFSAIPGAQGFQQSNPSVLATVSLLGSLEVFREAGGMIPLRNRSVHLTGYLEALLRKSKWWVSPEDAGRLESTGSKEKYGFTIITPSEPESRGSQLSLVFLPAGGELMPKVMEAMAERGVIGDSRKPDVIRLAPCALYNSFADVERTTTVLEEVLEVSFHVVSLHTNSGMIQIVPLCRIPPIPAGPAAICTTTPFLLRPDDALEHALKTSEEHGLPKIAVSAAQGKLLNLVAKSIGAKRILEVGTLGGYSTINLARALPADGHITTAELQQKHADVARANFQYAGLASKIDVIVGPAAETLPKLKPDQPFDLVFIDADKPSNLTYYIQAKRLIRKGGVIIVDNVVRNGRTADPAENTEDVIGVRKLLQHLKEDKDVDATTIATVGEKGFDGFTYIYVH
ncbi:hypothetical protein NM688_g6698 [Phlebia brevispora]|uniref:Uncharacterized protein n=1 Tax=Phlebia brevispora TaxID=194682 RepID=A0ACC1SDC8_9APHY|nr:hypothetical protein NM688_g6698 [Phlebia brevispora]